MQLAQRIRNRIWILSSPGIQNMTTNNDNYKAGLCKNNLVSAVTQITGNLDRWLLIKDAKTGLQLDLLFACTIKHKNQKFIPKFI